MIDDRFEAPDLGLEHALAERRERKVSAPLVVLAGGRPMVRLDDEIGLLELSKQSVQGRGPEAHLAVRPPGHFLHDAVAVPRSIGHRQQDVENLRLERQQPIDASQLIRHDVPAQYIYKTVYSLIQTTARRTGQLDHGRWSAWVNPRLWVESAR